MKSETRGEKRRTALPGKIKTDIDIEDLLVWAYRDRGVASRLSGDIVGTEREYIVRSWASTWGRVSEYAELGTFVDTSFRTPIGHDSIEADDDAAAVHAKVMTLEPEAFVLIIIHARAATRPGLFERGAPRLVPALRDNGKVEHLTHNHRAVACVIRWSHDPDRWEWDKQQYRVWRAALDVLADELRNQLNGFNVMTTRAGRAPWLAPRAIEETAA